MKNGIHDIIIIGGGLSGSYLAFKLKEKVQDILIIEKSKVIGGRLCTKPVGHGMADYGCQYINPKSKELISLVHLLKKKSLLKKIMMQVQEVRGITFIEKLILKGMSNGRLHMEIPVAKWQIR